MTEHILNARIYNLAYPPEVQAMLDVRMVRIQTGIHKEKRVLEGDIGKGMEQRQHRGT